VITGILNQYEGVGHLSPVNLYSRTFGDTHLSPSSEGRYIAFYTMELLRL
jgi:hypothetical protein